MPARRYRTKHYRERHVRTPGGRAAVHYKEKRGSLAKCASCGRLLGGVPRSRTGGVMSVPKSSRKPNRPFGGYLCPACARQAIKMTARA